MGNSKPSAKPAAKPKAKRKVVACEVCRGTGLFEARSDADKVCGSCKGAGRVKKVV